jgi:beclin 1
MFHSSGNCRSLTRLEDLCFFYSQSIQCGVPNHNPLYYLYTGIGPDRLEESFVVLQQASSSIGGYGGQNQQRHGRFSFDSQISTLAKVFEIASEETDFDQPLCIDCVADVKKELKQQIKDLEEDVAAFAALEAKLLADAETGGKAAPLDERQFSRKLKRAKEEVAEEETKLKKAEEELVKAEKRQAAADATAAQLSKIEVKYWHSFNAVMLFLHAAADYKDSLQQRVDAAEQEIQTLRRTNVLASVFHISFDGPYGTISGARLGSTPDNPVEWWEINAAWGQAVLLLDTLARAVGGGFKFTKGKLEPRGSFSRVHDSRGPAELFGPASKIVCLSFDRAQVAFLACLKEFEVALAQRGATNFKTGGPFSLSFPIDGDRVAGYSIRYGLSRDKAWTKALKYMLLDLKFCTRAALEVLNLRRHHPIGGGSGGGSSGGVGGPLPREGPGAVLR